MTAKASPRGWLAAILIATALILIPSLGNRFIIDDRWLVVENRYLGQWRFFWESFVNGALWFQDPLHPPARPYYRPLQNVWFAINLHLFGLNPVLWHAALIALHLLAAWLAFRVAAILTNDAPVALLAAAMFALMPIHAQAIGWVAAVGTPLAAAFELAAFAFHLFHNANRRPRDLALSLGLFAGALLSYDSAAAFPGLVAVHAFLFAPLLKGEGIGVRSNILSRARAAIAATWPYALVLAAYLPLRVWVLGALARPSPENPPGMTALTIALTIPRAIAADAALLAMPWRAGVAHRLELVWSAGSPAFLLPLIGLFSLLAAVVLLLRRQSHRRLYLFCAAWILIPIIPVLYLKAVVAQAAIQDRYLYLSSFGFCLLVADPLIGLARRGRSSARIGIAATGTILLVYAAGLFHAQRFWHDEIAWLSRCTFEAPNLEYCHSQLGIALARNGDDIGARREFQAAVNLEPNNGIDRFDLGLADDRLGNPVAAVREMTEGLARISNPPARSYVRLALTADTIGDSKTVDAALAHAASLPGGREAATAARAEIRARHGASYNDRGADFPARR